MNFIKVLLAGILAGIGIMIFTIFGLLPQSWLSIDIAELTLEIIPQNLPVLVSSCLSIIFCIVFFIISSNRKAKARHFLNHSLGFIAGVYLVLLCWLVFDWQKFPIQGAGLLLASIFAMFVASTFLLLELIPKVQEKDENDHKDELENDDEPVSFAEFVKIFSSGGNQHFADFIDSLKRLNIKLTAKSSSKSSQVICLDGKWGSGKSSFINVLKEFNPEKLDGSTLTPINQKINDGEIIWIEDFNPWNFGNSSEMIKEFFAVLEEKLDSKAGIYLGSNYNEYVEMVSQSLEQTTFFKSLFQILFAKKTIPQIKKLIENKLRDLGDKKIVFVLDDMDRQAPNDVLEVLRLVKSVANFPNMIFILPMDYKRVSSIIVNAYGESYQNYLQKIFQERVKINDFNFEDLFAIFRFYTGEILKLENGEDLQRQLYDYYRIQVWRIGIRARIDGLIKSGDIKGFSDKPNEVFEFTSLEKPVYLSKFLHFLIDGFTDYINLELDKDTQDELFINFNSEMRKFTKQLYYNYQYFGLDYNTADGLQMEIQRILDPVIAKNVYRRNGPIILPRINDFIDEFKPTIRDLKQFARVLSSKQDISIENSNRNLNNEIILSVSDMNFVDKIISEQYFDFV